MTTKAKFFIYILVLSVLLLGGITLILLPTNGAVFKSIGTSLVASAVVGLLNLFYELIVEDSRAIADALLESGITAIYNRRDLDRYHTLINSVTSQLDIAGYSLRAFFESFGQALAERLKKDKHLKVRLLVVDPDSEQSRARERLEGHVVGTFAGSIHQIQNTFRGYSNVSIRVAPGDLSTMVFRLDSIMFVGPQLTSCPSRASVTFEIERKKHSWLFDAYELEFESMWKNSDEFKPIATRQFQP